MPNSQDYQLLLCKFKINQICSICLCESVIIDSLCMKKKNEGISTRSNDVPMLEKGVVNKFSNGRFSNMTAKVWNECPKEIKEETQFEKARLLIKSYCKNLPI